MDDYSNWLQLFFIRFLIDYGTLEQSGCIFWIPGKILGHLAFWKLKIGQSIQKLHIFRRKKTWNHSFQPLPLPPLTIVHLCKERKGRFKKIWHLAYFGPKKFGVNKLRVNGNFDKTILGLKKCVGKKLLGQKKCWIKEI